MTCTLRVESPFSSRWLRTICTAGTEAGQALGSQAGDKIQANYRLVERIGSRAAVALDDVLQPVLQVAAERPYFRRERESRHGLAAVLFGTGAGDRDAGSGRPRSTGRPRR
jgi:hypothetical protein